MPVRRRQPRRVIAKKPTPEQVRYRKRRTDRENYWKQENSSRYKYKGD